MRHHRSAAGRACRLFAAAALTALALPVVGSGSAAAEPALQDFVGAAQADVVGGARHQLRLKVLGRARTGEPLLAGTGTSGYTPSQVRSYLGLTGTGVGQTIAIVTAYDAPHVERDLAVFNQTFGLPAPPSLRKVNQSGGMKYPAVNAAWALETALDVQWAHAVAPDASILLVEASTSSLTNLLTALSYAAKQPGVTVISNSWGTSEFSKQGAQDYRCRLVTAVCVFASGDNGNPGTYPGTNPHVLAVGGTTLRLDDAGAVQSESAWSGSGGGISLYSPKPAYQAASTSAPRRASPDVAYAGDPATGFAVYSSTAYQGQSGWFQMGGTSVGAPQWSGIVAATNQLRRSVGKGALTAVTSTGATPLHSALYRSSPSLGDVVSGTNGICGQVCSAGPGYDTVTGLGSPRRGLDLVLRDTP